MMWHICIYSAPYVYLINKLMTVTDRYIALTMVDVLKLTNLP